MNIKPKLFEVGSKIGYGQPLLSAYESVSDFSLPTPNIELDSEIREYQLDEDDQKGFVFLPFVSAFAHDLRRCLLGHVFRVNGYEPVILYNDDDLPIVPGTTVYNRSPRFKLEKKKHRIEWYRQNFGFETVSIGEVLGPGYQAPKIDQLESADLRSYTHNGVDVSGPADASTRRHLKIYTLEIRDPEVRDIYERYLQSAITIADTTEKMLDAYDVSLSVVNVPNYVEGKVPLDVCADDGINVYTTSGVYHEGMYSFGKHSNRNPLPHFGDVELISRAVETELSETERDEIHQLMTQRESGEVTRIHHTTNTDSSIGGSEQYTVGVFSHLLWDDALDPDAAMYENFYEWLDDTIRVGAEKENVHFVIKAHPAEKIKGTEEKVADWLEENHSPLPDNFTFLPPDTDVNTYALIRDLDAGVVYASTVGLEMAFNGKPVLVGGLPPYRDFGLTHDPQSQSEYQEELRNIQSLECTEDMQRRAERFAYFHFICKQIHLPHLADLGEDNTVEVRHDDLTSNESVYSSVIEQMLNGEEVLNEKCLNLK